MPGALGILDGQNATIQVVANGEDDGGLYNVHFPLAQKAERLDHC